MLPFIQARVHQGQGGVCIRPLSPPLSPGSPSPKRLYAYELPGQGFGARASVEARLRLCRASAHVLTEAAWHSGSRAAEVSCIYSVGTNRCRAPTSDREFAGSGAQSRPLSSLRSAPAWLPLARMPRQAAAARGLTTTTKIRTRKHASTLQGTQKAYTTLGYAVIETGGWRFFRPHRRGRRGGRHTPGVMLRRVEGHLC